MEREGLIKNTCAKICEIKAELAQIQETIAGLYTSINGVQGDGSGNLRISGGSNIRINQTGGNAIQIETIEDLDHLNAQSPLTYNPANNELKLIMDNVPTAASINPVRSGGLKDQMDTMQSGIDTNTAAISSLGNRVTAAEADIGSNADAINDMIDGTTEVGRANTANSATAAGSAASVPASGISGILSLSHGGTGGTSLKTVGGQSIVGTGDIPISSNTSCFPNPTLRGTTYDDY